MITDALDLVLFLVAVARAGPGPGAVAWLAAVLLALGAVRPERWAAALYRPLL